MSRGRRSRVAGSSLRIYNKIGARNLPGRRLDPGIQISTGSKSANIWEASGRLVSGLDVLTKHPGRIRERLIAAFDGGLAAVREHDFPMPDMADRWQDPLWQRQALDRASEHARAARAGMRRSQLS